MQVLNFQLLLSKQVLMIRFGIDYHASPARLLRVAAAVVRSSARTTHALFDAHPKGEGWARRGPKCRREGEESHETASWAFFNNRWFDMAPTGGKLRLPRVEKTVIMSDAKIDECLKKLRTRR